MSSKQTKFWLEDPSILFTDIVFFPTAQMSREEKLNALTRLAIAISVLMYSTDCKHPTTFLLGSILIIVAAEYIAKDKKPKSEILEGFSVLPTAIGEDLTQTIIAPSFSEEHRIPPPAYDHQTQVEFIEAPYEEPMRPQSYPYGQYLTKTNLLPSDEYLVHMNPSGGSKTAREYASSAFLRNDLAHRENLSRIHKKSLNRRFRMNNNDTWSPYSSY